VHLARLGNSYISTIGGAFEKYATKSSGADVIGANPIGDVFISSNDHNRAAFEKWASSAESSSADASAIDTIHNVNAWPSLNIKKATFDVEQFCGNEWVEAGATPSSKSSDTSNKSSDASNKSSDPTKYTDNDNEDDDDIFKSTSPSKDSRLQRRDSGSSKSGLSKSGLSKSNSGSSSSSKDSKVSSPGSKYGIDSKFNTESKSFKSSGLSTPKISASMQAVCERKFYRATGCGKADALEPAEDVINMLKDIDSWHLTDCNDEKHCDRQQVVPKVWTKPIPDLSQFGGIC